MKKAFFCIAVVLSLLTVLVSCEDTTGASTGTVSVSITGSTIDTAHGLYAYAYVAGETDLNNQDKVVACGWHQIFSGETSFTMMLDDGAWDPTDTVWAAPGGGTYDIYVYTAGDDGDPTVGSSGYMTDPMPITLTISGNHTIAVDFADMIPYVDPTAPATD